MTYEARCKSALAAIEETPELSDCLYDIGLLPEMPGKTMKEYDHMLTIAEHFIDIRHRHQQELAALSAKALEDVREWGAYADDYSKKKWRFDVCVAKWEQRAALAGQVQVANPAVGVQNWRKKPVVIQAIRWTGANLKDVIAFTGLHPSASKWTWDEYASIVEKEGLKIFTLEGPMMASTGDYIIKGVKGEFYACKPDIFAQTYEQCDDHNTARQDNKAGAASSGADFSSPSSGALPNTPGPDGAVPVAWMIEWRNADGEVRKAICGHNSVGDYRDFDPNAKSTPLYALRSQAGRGE